MGINTSCKEIAKKDASINNGLEGVIKVVGLTNFGTARMLGGIFQLDLATGTPTLNFCDPVENPETNPDLVSTRVWGSIFE